MAKRFTDTDKWDDPWFCSLSNAEKLFWIYLCDKCDMTGKWKANIPLAKFHISDLQINPETWAGRIETEGDTWIIKKFVPFQYKSLNPANRFHKAILDRLGPNKALIEPSKALTRALHGPKDKDKDKEKDKEQLKDVAVTAEPQDYKTPNYKTEPLRAIVHVYKIVKGFEQDDRSWDKTYFPRFSKSAKELLDFFSQDTVKAMTCIESLGEYFKEKGLTWTLETVLKHAADWKLRNGGSNESNRRYANRPSISLPKPKRRPEGDSAENRGLASAGQILDTLRDNKNLPIDIRRGDLGAGTGDAEPVERIPEDPLEEQADRG